MPNVSRSDQRKTTYKRLRDAGFTRKFARRHDKASDAEVSELIKEIQGFGQRHAEEQSLRRQAARGRHGAEEKLRAIHEERAIRLREQGTQPPVYAPVPKIKPTDVDWYVATSKQLSVKLRELKRETSPEEYAEAKESMKAIRKILQRKAVLGKESVTLEEYRYVTAMLQAFGFVGEEIIELYGSEPED